MVLEKCLVMFCIHSLTLEWDGREEHFWSLLNVCVFAVSVGDVIRGTVVRDPVDRLLLTFHRHLILLPE